MKTATRAAKSKPKAAEKRKPVAEKRTNRITKHIAAQKRAKEKAVKNIAKELRALKVAGIPMRDKALVELFGIRSNQSGVTVDENNAETFSAYYSGVTLLSNVIGMLPTAVYQEQKGGGYEICKQHTGTEIFRDQMNANLTAIVGKEMLQRSTITWGNGYAKIERVGGKQGMPTGIWPLSPDQTTAEYNDKGTIVYKFTKKFAGEVDTEYSSEEIIHIPGMCFDGLSGRSVVQLANESIGVGLASERFGGSFFGNNAIPGGIVTHPGDLSAEGEQQLRDELERKMKGPYKAKKLLVLDEGMKYQQIGIPPEDSQFLQTRQFQVIEIARWLRIPPHMLFDMMGSTFSNIENMSLQFLIYSIQPWIVRWLQELNRKLLTKEERQNDKLKFSFDVSELLQMDTKTRFEVYSSGKNMSVFTLNDILRREGMPTVNSEIGDIRIAPSTMKVLGDVDPNTPIDPTVMQNAYLTVKIMSSEGKKPVKWKNAKAVFNAMIPSASDEAVNALLRSSADAGYVTVKDQTRDQKATIRK
jgi:HK97 family phage portal protein